MPTASSLAWKTSLWKVRTLHSQQIKERGALPMIDRGDIRQKSSQQYLGFTGCRALVMVSSVTLLTAWLQNSKKRAERSERLMYEQSHRDYLRSVICITVCLSRLLIITADNATIPQSPARQKCQRTEAGERGNYWHADASAWCCCARCKIHEGVSRISFNDALRDDVAAGRRRLHISTVCQSGVKLPTLWRDNAASPWPGRHRWTGLFHLRERLITMQKQLEGTQKYINEQCR